MHTNPETLGDIIKYYREKSDYTVEELANKVGITERYLYRIENEGKTPSYAVLYKIVRLLYISPERIFYPETNIHMSQIKSITYMLCKCDKKTLEIIENIIKAMIVM